MIDDLKQDRSHWLLKDEASDRRSRRDKSVNQARLTAVRQNTLNLIYRRGNTSSAALVYGKDAMK